LQLYREGSSGNWFRGKGTLRDGVDSRIYYGIPFAVLAVSRFRLLREKVGQEELDFCFADEGWSERRDGGRERRFSTSE